MINHCKNCSTLTRQRFRRSGKKIFAPRCRSGYNVTNLHGVYKFHYFPLDKCVHQLGLEKNRFPSVLAVISMLNQSQDAGRVNHNQSYFHRISAFFPFMPYRLHKVFRQISDCFQLYFLTCATVFRNFTLNFTLFPTNFTKFQKNIHFKFQYLFRSGGR